MSVKVDKELVKHVASVARLNLTDVEVERFEKQMKGTLDIFSIIDEVDTKNVEPSFHSVPVKDSLREDVPEKSLDSETALKNAKNKEKGFFKGPRAV